MGYIKREFIDKILDIANIEQVIGDFVELKRAGANLKGKSPFVEEKSPSFMVSPVKQIWKDFSSGKGGNLINFLMELKGWSYPEAIEYLSQKYNESIQYEDSEMAQKKAAEISKKEEIRPVLKATLEQYQKQFHQLPDNHPAKQEVFEKRKYTQDDIIEWGIGYAPENFLYDLLKNSGRVNQGIQLGLLGEGQYNVYDKYTNRVIYPIHDKNGLLIGLAGRDLSGKKEAAKWINPKVDDDNILYDKSKVWFGLHKARTEIRKRNEAFIVEGYNDVIAMHKYGCINTVAPCGTAITEQQMNELRKLCDKVVFVMDPDEAGKRSVIKHSRLFIKKGFRVEVVTLDYDPDDFSRTYSDVISLCGGLQFMFNHEVRKDAFKILMEDELQGSDIDKSRGAQNLANLIAEITDTAMVEIYTGWLQKESKIKLLTIKKWIKEYQESIVEEFITNTFTEYELPKNINIPLNQLEDDIKRYGIFMANNQIWGALPEATDGKVYFTSLSNFEIEIINHMRDEGRAKKLVRIKNVLNKEFIFDTDSENFLTLIGFCKMVDAHGDFRFKGTVKDLSKIRDYLYEKMGSGSKIDVLGWQPDGKFWCWNNAALTEDGKDVEINENGILILGDVHYYIPSANSIYKNDTTKFPSQKRFIKMHNPINFSSFLMQVYKVHREHTISAILYGFTCLFRDVVIEKLNRFPILFLCGPGGTGKDELIEIIQGLTGIPQSPINLEANISTAKGAVRSTAQFRNGISLLSEYKRGNREHDGMLKQFYDNIGYTKGNLDSHISTDYVPIESGVILTGNDFPDVEPLIQRLVWNEMSKNIFNSNELKEFDKLKDMMRDGMSGYAHEILRHRKAIVEDLDKVQRQWKQILKETFPEAKERMIANMSILASFYQILRDKQIVQFPFSQDEMIQHFREGVNNQLRRINSGSMLNKFWDVFIACLRGSMDNRLNIGLEINMEANKLFMQWSRCYGVINKQWWQMYHEAPPAKTTLLEQIESAGILCQKEDVYNFSKGRNGFRSSAIAIDTNLMDEVLREDILVSYEIQLNSGTLFSNSNAKGENETGSEPKLPF